MVWGLFWEGFGALLASLGSLVQHFLMSVIDSVFQFSPKVVPEVAGARFGIILVIFR